MASGGGSQNLVVSSYLIEVYDLKVLHKSYFYFVELLVNIITFLKTFNDNLFKTFMEEILFENQLHFEENYSDHFVRVEEINGLDVGLYA